MIALCKAIICVLFIGRGLIVFIVHYSNCSSAFFFSKLE